eukprot:TRINITY_DN24876_c0_g1_i1.p1 TRINITY_DN24876_c0_g1~~TRINITY_DN24876_c0_g1_i1.p1  ORF type:complete len:304 (-),score=23.99 TRINITY_DN24876_c0_g1_i1:481-1392(-)
MLRSPLLLHLRRRGWTVHMPKTAGCFSCGSPDHLARDCPEQKLRCHSCGETGHFARHCPKFLAATGARLCGEPACFVRRFIVPLRRLPGDGEIDLDDLLQGRVDTACRITSSAFFLSRAVRHNTEVLFSLRQGRLRCLHLVGGDIKDLRPDELTIARKLRSALRGEDTKRKGGMFVHDAGLSEVLAESFSSDAAPWSLALEFHEDGDMDIDEVVEVIARRREEAATNGRTGHGCVTALIGDGEGVDEADLAAYRSWSLKHGSAPLRVKIGPLSLLGSHCVVLLHHFLDRAHACPSKLWAEGHG